MQLSPPETETLPGGQITEKQGFVPESTFGSLFDHFSANCCRDPWKTLLLYFCIYFIVHILSQIRQKNYYIHILISMH
jgi:hypothetical protein